MKAIMRRFRPEQLRELVIVLLIVVLILFFATQINGYLTGRTFNRVSTSVAIIAVVAVGQTLVVLARNIDLSVGSIVGVTAYFVGTLLSKNNEIPPAVVVLMAMGMGAVMGSLNGVLVAYGRVPAIITTLGTLALFRSLLVQFSGSKTVLTSTMPEWMQKLPQVNIFSIGALDVRLIVGVAIAVVILFQLVLTYLHFGRRLYAIGSNPDAAKVAGFPAQRIVFLSYVLCGMLCGLAGFMYLTRFGTITVVAGQGIEMQSVAAVVVGGVSTLGGTGTAVGAFLGAILIGLLEQSLIRWPLISPFWIQFLQGLLILLAVAADFVIMNRVRRMWSRSELTVETNEEATHGA
jgi:rhamnose transport system permease protein